MKTTASLPNRASRPASHAFAVLCASLCLAASALGDKPPAARLDVTVQPEGAQVIVDGKPRGAAPCQIFDLAPGEHHLHVTAPSCKPLDEFVRAEPGGFVQKSYSLESEKGLVLIKTVPSGAEVRCNGVSLGATPLLVTTLPSGRTHVFELALNGYQTRRIDIPLEGRTPVVREENLALDSGTVELTTDPAGATVTVNGVERGVTPTTLSNIPKGLATIAVKLAGYREESRELRVTPGDRQTLALTLKAMPARLNVVSSPEQARVFLDNGYQGKTPVTITSVAPGAHELRVELAGHAPVTRKITLGNGAEGTEEFKMDSVLGRLEVSTRPAGAKILVDGKAVGTTKALGDASRSQILALENVAAGEHSVMARLDGYQDVARKITIKANGTGQLFLSLPRVFTPDTEIETIRGIYRGVLVKKDFFGAITIETSPGVEQTFKPDDIRKVTPISR
ncbi:MAG: PEGA domain-containing protein [Kiritimatiellae bacterium]|nr:PEGA domain-containing protein [Kiritimatiellia bacterium]